MPLAEVSGLLPPAAETEMACCLRKRLCGSLDGTRAAPSCILTLRHRDGDNQNQFDHLDYWGRLRRVAIGSTQRQVE